MHEIYYSLSFGYDSFIELWSKFCCVRGTPECLIQIPGGMKLFCNCESKESHAFLPADQTAPGCPGVRYTGTLETKGPDPRLLKSGILEICAAAAFFFDVSVFNKFHFLRQEMAALPRGAAPEPSPSLTPAKAGCLPPFQLHQGIS